MEPTELAELDARIKLLRGELKRARVHIELGELEAVRLLLESVGRESASVAEDLRLQGVLLAHERGSRHPPA